MRKRIFFLSFTVIFSGLACAQSKQTEKLEQTWLGYFNQTRFSKHWGAWADIHLRTKEDLIQDFSQGIIRVGLTYYLGKETKLTAGYAFINHFPADNHKNISQPEHRSWHQLQWHTKSSRVKLMQWFRLEERWRRKILNDDALADGYLFNFRGRYNILAQFALGKKPFQPGQLALVLSNEVFVNFGKQVVNNYFDQNRFFAGFHLYMNRHDQLQFGYKNLFQQLAAGNRYRSNQVFRVFYFHTLDLTEKK